MPANISGPGAASPAGERFWVVVGDIHGATENFKMIPGLPEAAGVIVTGDLTNYGGAAEALKVMRELEAPGLPVLAQIGNMDLAEVDAWLAEKGVNLHAACRELAPGVAIMGVGGSTPTPGHTPSEFQEADYARWLAAEEQEALAWPHRVLVSHNPPRDTACDVLPGGLHVGSVSVREFIARARPEVCLCGHIHEARATDTIDGCQIVNPGALAEGGYALLRFSGGRLSAELKSL